jgi:hypothetical protein
MSEYNNIIGKVKIFFYNTIGLLWAFVGIISPSGSNEKMLCIPGAIIIFICLDILEKLESKDNGE